MKLKAIKKHLDSPINPISNVIKEFVEQFISTNRLLLYKIDFDGEDFENAVKIDSYESMAKHV